MATTAPLSLSHTRSITLHKHHRKPLVSAQTRPTNHFKRRPLILIAATISTTSLPSLLSRASETSGEEIKSPNEKSPDITITDRIFMDFSVCPNYFRSERTLGDEVTSCPESEVLGRVVLGLYGKLVPRTVSNFKAMCTGLAGSSYKGTLVHKIFQGQYLMAGKQGRKDKGEVQIPMNLQRNTESVDSRSFLLTHSRPGTVSLCLSENDDEDDIKLDPNYRNVEFLITTGPGPCPQLDNRNIVFGTVLEGLDVVTTMATIPTYKPAERIRQFNDFAEFLGDERAQNARNIWNRPLKTVYISACGELNVAKPSLSPTLP